MSIPESGDGALVIIPTFNERENLELIVSRVLAAVPEANVLIMDDDSPDGTGQLADEISARDPRVRVEHRAGKAGLGAAYIAGFAIGLERGYSFLIELDADGSHPPEKLPEMLGTAAQLPEVGVVIGSRWAPGGSVVDWPRRREILSRGANTYAGLMLGVPVRDTTAGFRVYRAATIAALDLSAVDSKGYCFQIDMTLRVLDSGWEVREVPIEFRDREYGVSKMSGGIILEAMLRVTTWGLERRILRRKTHAVMNPA